METALEIEAGAPASPRIGPLLNVRHEAFARARARGLNQSKAYVAAGFVANRGGASTLAKRGDISVRIAELIREATEIREARLEDTIRALLQLAKTKGLEGTAAGVKEARMARLEAWRLSEVLSARETADDDDILPPELTEAEWEAKYGPNAP